MAHANSEDRAAYVVDSRADAEKVVIREALEILARRLARDTQYFCSPADTRNYLTLMLADRPHEMFCVIWLDAQNRMIAFDELFRGTLTQTSVYPREVIKEALKRNAAAVILCHNHPSGVAEPSRADELLTTELKTALHYIDVRVLDHIIVAGTKTLSFAERGLI